MKISAELFLFQVSEVSLRLGKAVTTGIAIGLEKAVEVLDTLGSSLTNLNVSSGFSSGAAIKGNKISILAFEVANNLISNLKFRNHGRNNQRNKIL